MSDDDTITVITKSGAYFEERGEAGAYVRLEDVAELVKAARLVHDTSDSPHGARLWEALKPFEGP